MMRCVSGVPGHLMRGRRPIQEEPGLISEVRSNHQTLQALTIASRQNLIHMQAVFDTKPSGSTRYAHAFCLRAHAVNVAVLIILNRVLYSIDVTSCRDLSQEAEELSNESISMAREAEQYAPLGCSYVPLCLCAAWIGFLGFGRRMCDERLLLFFYNQSEAAGLVDVLRVKVQELENLRTARSVSLITASAWPELQEDDQGPWYGNLFSEVGLD
jgi:hypothetical protein